MENESSVCFLCRRKQSHLKILLFSLCPPVPLSIGLGPLRNGEICYGKAQECSAFNLLPKIKRVFDLVEKGMN